MDNKILLQDLAQGISNRTSSPKKDAEAFLRNVFDIISQYLQEDKIVKIKGLGTFKVVEVSGRDSVNVNTGERIHIHGHSKISFTPDNGLRDQVNKPFAEFETIVLNNGVDISYLESVPSKEQEDESSADDVPEVQELQIHEPETEQEQEVETLQTESLDEVAKDTNIAEEVIENTEVAENTSEQVADNITEEVAENTSEQVAENITEEVVENTTDEVVENTAEEVVENTAEEVTENVQEEVEQQSVDEVAENTEDEVAAEKEEAKAEEVSTAENISEESSNISSINTANESSDNTSNEKVVYIERRPCRCCILCYIILILAMMALSYVAGLQHWFMPRRHFPRPNFEYVHQQKHKQQHPKKQTTNTTSSSASQSDTVVGNSDSDSTKAKPVVEAPSTNQQTAKVPASKPTLNTNDAPASKPTSNTNVTPASKPTSNTNVAPVQQTATSTKYPNGNYKIVGTRCTHVLKAGEGLYRLARIYYGNMNMARYITKYNNIANPNVVSEGTILKIPEIEKVE